MSAQGGSLPSPRRPAGSRTSSTVGSAGASARTRRNAREENDITVTGESYREGGRASPYRASRATSLASTNPE